MMGNSFLASHPFCVFCALCGSSCIQGSGIVGGIFPQGAAAGLASFAPLVRKSGEEMVPQRAQSSQRKGKATIKESDP